MGAGGPCPIHVFLYAIQTSGSGVIVDAPHDYVLTNSHVIENSDKVAATLGSGALDID